jgi:nitric oxide reductase subunit C
MPGTRRFFALSLAAASAVALIFLLLIFAGRGASPAEIPPTQLVHMDDAMGGFGVWRSQGCAGCHSLYGEGGGYAPDLSQVYDQRGDQYLREFMVNPAAFHPDQRVMPRFGLTVSEADSLITFLRWVSQQPNADWSPRPIMVSGQGETSFAPYAATAAPSLPDDPIELGRYWFSRPPAACATCHSLEPEVVIVGPSLAGVATRAATRIPGQSAEAYLRNSILHPGDFVVPGFQNVMAQNLGEILTFEQINEIIAFLLTLE